MLVGLGIVVVVFLLWRLVKSQETANQINAARTAHQITTNVVNSISSQLGTWEQAKSRGRTIEYTDSMLSGLGYSEEEGRKQLLNTDDEFQTVLAETLDRGIRCRFLRSEDYDHANVFWPGEQPQRYRQCADYCDQACNAPADIPDSYVECPFCGSETSWVQPDSEDVNEWSKHAEVWSKFRSLYPADANGIEQENLAEIAVNRGKREADMRTLLNEYAELDDGQ